MTKYCTKRRSVTISGRTFWMLFRKKCLRLECAAPLKRNKPIRSTFAQNAKCASCKKEIYKNDVQATTEGPYRTIHKTWIKRTFFFCPRLQCISKLPRYSFIIPYKIGMTLTISPDVAINEKLKNDLSLV